MRLCASAAALPPSGGCRLRVFRAFQPYATVRQCASASLRRLQPPSPACLSALRVCETVCLCLPPTAAASESFSLMRLCASASLRRLQHARLRVIRAFQPYATVRQCASASLRRLPPPSPACLSALRDCATVCLCLPPAAAASESFVPFSPTRLCDSVPLPPSGGCRLQVPRAFQPYATVRQCACASLRRLPPQSSACLAALRDAGYGAPYSIRCPRWSVRRHL